MKKLTSILLVMVLILGLLGVALAEAGSSANHTVSIVIQAIDEITVTSGPTLTFNAGTIKASGGGDYVVGSDAFQITDTSTTYSVTTNSDANKKITAHIDAALTAAGLQLYVTLASASGVSSNEVEITSVVVAAPATVVTGLLKEADVDQTITYRAVATVETPLATYSPLVTYTITDQS